MSFLSILTTVAHVAAPIAEVAIPPAAPVIAAVDGVFGRLQTAIASTEAHPAMQGQPGPVKAQAVVDDFEAALKTLTMLLNLTGHTIQYDKDALQDAINHQVTAFNAMARVKASFSVT